MQGLEESLEVIEVQKSLEFYLLSKGLLILYNLAIIITIMNATCVLLWGQCRYSNEYGTSGARHAGSRRETRDSWQ